MRRTLFDSQLFLPMCGARSTTARTSEGICSASWAAATLPSVSLAAVERHAGRGRAGVVATQVEDNLRVGEGPN